MHFPICPDDTLKVWSSLVDSPARSCPTLFGLSLPRPHPLYRRLTWVCVQFPICFNKPSIPYLKVAEAKKEAMASIDLMRERFNRIRQDELARGGLVIVVAVYGKLLDGEFGFRCVLLFYVICLLKY